MERTCVWFRHVIQNSDEIQKCLCRKARALTTIEGPEWQLEYQFPLDMMMLLYNVEFNPYMSLIFQGWTARRLPNGWMLVATGGRKSRPHEKKASWKNMFLTEPACRKMRLEPAYLDNNAWAPDRESCENWNWGSMWDYVSGKKPNPNYSNIIENDSGITVRQFARELDAADWNWWVLKML